ncbi:MAG: hypothetical protein ACREMY_01495 [bacterium]
MPFQHGSALDCHWRCPGFDPRLRAFRTGFGRAPCHPPGSQSAETQTGIGGELAGLQESSGTTLRLTNLHGDVVASASLSPTVTSLTATFRFGEFGNPVAGGAGRFG